jgi:hypothetical protein
VDAELDTTHCSANAYFDVIVNFTRRCRFGEPLLCRLRKRQWRRLRRNLKPAAAAAPVIYSTISRVASNAVSFVPAADPLHSHSVLTASNGNRILG